MYHYRKRQRTLNVSFFLEWCANNIEIAATGMNYKNLLQISNKSLDNRLFPDIVVF